MQKTAFLYAFIAVLMWSTVATAFKIGLQGMLPSQFLFLSSLTAFITLALWLAWRGELRDFNQLKTGHLLDVALRSVMLFVYYLLVLNAFDLLPAQIAQPINSTWAIALAIFSSLLLRQPFGTKEFCFMLLGYSGVVIIAFGGGGELGPLNPWGLASVLCSATLYALFWTASTYSRLPQDLALCLIFGLTCLMSFALVLYTGNTLLGTSWWAALHIGLFEMAIPSMLWGLALKISTSVARISPISFLVPFLSLLWVSLFLGESIALSTLMGLLCIVVGTFLQQKEAHKRFVQKA